jgi:hypothetical protein
MMMKIIYSRKRVVAAIILLISSSAIAQQKYTVFNRALSDGKEKESIHLNAAEGAGVAWINNMELTNGSIEVDIKGKDTFQLSFVGIAFHGTNDSMYEAIYFRPFNFHSPDPLRKTHAVQYVSDPGFDWPVLRSQFTDKYEQPISPAPDPNDWFHARIELNDKKIVVFVNGSKTPALIVESLQTIPGKKIGYWVGNNSFGDWKNLRIVGAVITKDNR